MEAQQRRPSVAERELDVMLDCYRQLRDLSPRGRQLALDWLSYILSEVEVPF